MSAWCSEFCPFIQDCRECEYQGESQPVVRGSTQVAGRLDPVAKTPAPASTGPGRGRTDHPETEGSTA